MALLVLAVPAQAQTPPVQISARADVVKAEPGASVRHALYPHALDLPPEGVDVRLQCRVLRRSGRPTECRAPGAPREIAAVALRRARLFVLDVEALAGGPVLPGELNPLVRDVKVELVERIAPSDRRDTAFASSERVPLEDLDYADLPAGEIAGNLYPAMALRREAWARVQTACQVQPDRKLFCIDPEVTETNWDAMPASVREEFELGALVAASGVTLTPTLADGRDSAGAVVTLGVLFRTGD